MANKGGDLTSFSCLFNFSIFQIVLNRQNISILEKISTNSILLLQLFKETKDGGWMYTSPLETRMQSTEAATSGAVASSTRTEDLTNASSAQSSI